MSKNIRLQSFLSIVSMVVACFLSVSCNNTKEILDTPYLNLEGTFASALGDGDGFILSIRSNVEWEVSAEDESGVPVDWIKFTETTGAGDADILGIVKQGSRDSERSCNFVVRSIQGNQEAKIRFSQDKFVPVLRPMLFSNLITTASLLGLGESEAMLDFMVVEALVAAVPGENIPEDYVYLTDDGTWAVRAAIPNGTSVKTGDKVQVETTGGLLKREQNGSVTIELQTPVTVVSSGNDVPVARIQPSAVSRYENALVQVYPCQVQESYIGKNWSGVIGLVTDDAEHGNFDVEVASGASFASVQAPAGSGVVSGIVIGGKIHPRNAADIKIAETGRDSYSVDPYQIVPVRAFYHLGTKANSFSNGALSGGTKFTFKDDAEYSIAGASVEKVGGKSNGMAMNAAVKTPFQSCCTIKKWDAADTYLLYTIPVNQKIYGDLEFGFSISCGVAGAFSASWEVFWSTDKVSWKKVDAVYGAANQTLGIGDSGKFAFASKEHQHNRMTASINIPEGEAISSGNMYIKLVHPPIAAEYSSKTLRVNAGFYLTNATPFPEQENYANVILQENFNNALNGINPVVGFPVYYLALNSYMVEYYGKFQVVGNANMLRGCLHLSSSAGENYLVASPSSLTGTSDLILKFKAAPYVNPEAAKLAVANNMISVACEGGGTAGEIVWDNPDFESDPYNWHNATVKITGASSATRIKIGNLDSSSSGASFFIDDIVLSR